jgi:hypothetical protein
MLCLQTYVRFVPKADIPQGPNSHSIVPPRGIEAIVL